MNEMFKMVREFQEKFNQPLEVDMERELLEFRAELIMEEIDELNQEIFFYESNDKEKLTKELADILYVTIGFATTFGLPLEEVFKRVHESNMTKQGIKRGDGKILKGATYEAPKLEDLF